MAFPRLRLAAVDGVTVVPVTHVPDGPEALCIPAMLPERAAETPRMIDTAIESLKRLSRAFSEVT